jgi:uncharacterized protein (TIGR01620 family)
MKEDKMKEGFSVDIDELIKQNPKMKTNSETLHNNTNKTSQSFNFKEKEDDNLEDIFKKGFTIDPNEQEALFKKEEVKTNEKGSTIANKEELLEEEELPSARFFSSPVFWGFVLVLVFATCQTYAYIKAAFLDSSILGIVWSSVFLFVVLMLIYTIYKEFGTVLLLKDADKTRKEVNEIIDHGKYKDALKITKHLSDLSHIHQSEYDSFTQKLAPNFSSKEVLELYEELILKKLDKKAIDLVVKRSVENGIVVALSPLAWLDMLFTLARTLKMIREIAQIYGHNCGYWGRMQIYRRVFKNLVFIGMTDLATDALLDVIGTSALKKLSANMAQGISAGIYSTRLGYMAIKAIRPIQINKNVITLGMLRKELLTHPKIKEIIFASDKIS